MRAHSNIRHFLLPTALTLTVAVTVSSLSFSDQLSAQEADKPETSQQWQKAAEGHATTPGNAAPSASSPVDKTRQHARRAPSVSKSPVVNNGIDADNQIGQDVFQVLLAEIALRRGNSSLASSAYADLALRTQDPEALERTIEIALYSRQFDVALDAARLWTELDPKSVKARELQASAMVFARQTDELASVLSRLLELDETKRADILLGLNPLLAQLNDRMTALEIIETVSRPYADMAEAHYGIAIAAASAEQNERAQSEARRALELRPSWEKAALLQTQLLLRASAQDAIDFLSGFVNQNPHLREAKVQLARLMTSEKRYDEARRQFKNTLKDNADDPEIVFAIALIALQQKDYPEAENYFKRLLTIPEADKNTAFFFLGQIAEENERIEEAMDNYAKVFSGEHFISAQIHWAYLLARQGRIEEARTQLHTAPSKNVQERVQLTIAEAGLLREAKQYRAAFAVLEAALSDQPEQPDLLYESALLLEKLDSLDLMERRLRKLIVLRPDNPLAYNALGYSLADRNLRLDEAHALIERAYKLSPDDFYILDSMGWVLYRQGDLPGALHYLEKARAKKDDPEVAAHIGEVMWTMGRQDEARQIWQEAQKKHPENEALIEVIKKFLP